MGLPSIEALKSDLFDTLSSKGYDPVGLDSTGKETPNPENSDVIRFELKDQNGVSAGQGWIGIELKKERAEDKKNLVLWINPDLLKSPEFDSFLSLLRGWRRDKNVGFELKTKKGQLVHDMKKRTIMKEKEKLEEGYYPLGKKSSYSDNVPTVKIILQHTRQLEEGEQRFRNIARIFVENANGERFLIPTNRPGLARVFARHIAEGGTPYDDKAKHISTLVEEYTKMAGFVRATKNGQFNESAQRLVNEGVSHYQNLRETLSRMTTHKGYVKYFESYTPVLNEESDENSLNELFVRETLDPRIESVLPILSRLSKNLNEMNEVKELDEWAQSLIEGGDGGEASEETDGDTAGNAGEGGAEDVSVNEEEDVGLKIADSNEVAEVIFQSLKGEKDLNSSDIYNIIDEYQDLMSDEGYEVNQDDVAQLLIKKLNIISEAPGAMTLKHNQNTEKKNLKAFDLEEEAKVKYEVKMGDQPVGYFDGKFFVPYPKYKTIYKSGKLEGLPLGHEIDKERGPISNKDLAMGSIGLEESAADAPIEKMSDSDLADYLGVSVKFVSQNRKKAEQAARDKTDDNIDESSLPGLQTLPYKIKPNDGTPKIKNLPYEIKPSDGTPKIKNLPYKVPPGEYKKIKEQDEGYGAVTGMKSQGTDWDKIAQQGQQVATVRVNGNETIVSVTNPNKEGEYRVRITQGDNFKEYITKTPPDLSNANIDKVAAGEPKKIKEQDESYREISNLNDFKTGTIGSVVQYKDGKFGFKYGDKLSPQKFTSRRDADNALYAHHKQGMAEDIDNLTTAQQSAQMQKQGGELKIPKQDFDSMSQGYAIDKGMQKDIKASTDKEGNIDATKLLSKGVDRMMPAMGGAVRDLNKVYYRDMPGNLQNRQKRDPEGFKKEYDALDPESRAEIDKQLAITPAQAKANYKATQGAVDKQMTDMGYTKYGYNLQSRPVVNRIKNAGAWVKDKFNENLNEGSVKQAMWDDAENMSLDQFTEKYGDEDWVKEFWHNINDIDEGLDANQKRAGQLGPTEPVGKNEKNLRGKLVGASESREFDDIKRLAGLK